MTRVLKTTAIAPLLLNGYALVANAGLSSVLGIVFWILATRLYTQDQVGLAAALISSMTTISYLSQMNLSSFLTRFLPSSHSKSGRLILLSYGAAALVATLVATAFALGVGNFAEPLEVIRSNSFALVFFVLATVTWTIFALQDAALSGLRRSVVVPIENAIYSVLKIGFLVGLAMLVLPEPGGIFLAWTLPLVPVVVVVNLMIFRRLPSGTSDDQSRAPDMRTVGRFLGWDFFGSLALAAGLGLAPLMVTASAGVASTASYHLAWSFSYAVYLVGRSMSVSLVAEGATEPLRLRRLIADTLSHTLILVFGAVVVMFAAAPLIMGIFGPGYVDEGAPILRVLVLSCLPWAVTTIYCAVARVQGQTQFVALVQACTLAVLVASSSALLPIYGALGVALGWLLAHTTVCIGIILIVILKGGTGALIDWLLALASSAARLASGLLAQIRGIRGQPGVLAAVPLGDLKHPELEKLTPTPITGSLTDVSAVFLKSADPESGSEAVLKYSTSEPGIAALKRSAQVLDMLNVDQRLEPYHDIIPKILLAEPVGAGFRTVETAMTGTEGRRFLADSVHAKTGLRVAASTMADLHRRSSTSRVLDVAWVTEWIDKPIQVVSGGARNIAKQNDSRTTALEKLRHDLRETFLGKQENVGLGHGDLWPGNLFFSVSENEGSEVVLSGLIDWDAARTDAIAAFDACHLGLTFRMSRSGEELGPVVSDFLVNGGWTREERDLLGISISADEIDPGFERAVVLLTWLNHIATVLKKSNRTAKNLLWSAVNVDRVLPSIAPSAKVHN